MIAARLEKILGSVLLVGVLISASIVLFGGTIYLIRHGASPVHYRVFRGERSDLCSVEGILDDMKSFSGRGIIQMGLLLLVILQLIRVALTGVLFAVVRDRVFVAITTLVLAMLVYGLVFER